MRPSSGTSDREVGASGLGSTSAGSSSAVAREKTLKFRTQTPNTRRLCIQLHMNEFACPFGEDDQLTSTLVSNVFRRIPDPVSFCLLAMLSLTGCAATTNPSSFAHGTKVGYDPYLRTTSIVGPNISLFPVNYFLDRINGQD